MDNLKKLHLIDTNISSDGIKELRRALVNCKVISTSNELMGLSNVESDDLKEQEEFHKRTIFGFNRKIKKLEKALQDALQNDSKKVKSIEVELEKWKVRLMDEKKRFENMIHQNPSPSAPNTPKK